MQWHNHAYSGICAFICMSQREKIKYTSKIFSTTTNEFYSSSIHSTELYFLAGFKESHTKIIRNDKINCIYSLIIPNLQNVEYIFR